MMPTAAEAYNNALLQKNNLISKQWEEIEAGIKNACNEGKFYFHYDNLLYIETEKKLIELGYVVKFNRNFGYYFIEWEGEN